MKKIWNFLKSMKFGCILLAVLSLISAVGSLIQQGQDAMYYVTKYPDWYQIILKTGADHIFTSWYFIAVTVLLCLNLTFCSLIRFNKIRKKPEVNPAGLKYEALDETGRKYLKKYLEVHHFRKEEKKDGTIYSSAAFGRYGTFITHLGILLTVIFFSLAMYLPVTVDQSCMPQDSITLDDGSQIYVDSFHIEDSSGKLDYRSDIKVTLADGRESDMHEISVNHPYKFGPYKIYQQTYGTKGKITVTDSSGKQDSFVLEANDLLSADGKNGILYDNLYPGYTIQDGKMSLETSTSGRYDNPVYVFTTIEDGIQKEVLLAFPEDEVTLGGFTFHFEQPVEYPGLRIKKSPEFINYLLGISVLILTFGLVVSLFMSPLTVVISDQGYALLGNRQEGIRLALMNRKKEKKEKENKDGKERGKSNA